VDLYDVDAVERAESEIDNFISKRALEKVEANRTEEMWRTSELRHRHKIRLANGHAWIEYFDVFPAYTRRGSTGPRAARGRGVSYEPMCRY
jgi:hypothetical protein